MTISLDMAASVSVRLIFSFQVPPVLGTAESVSLRVSTNTYVEFNDLQAKKTSDKIVEHDVLVSFVLMKTSELLDEAPVKLDTIRNSRYS